MDNHGDHAGLLLIEDNPQDLELALRALRKGGMDGSVKVVRDGVEALEILTRTHAVIPRVILLDLKLPRMNGLELLRRLKEDPRTQGIPAVVLTSSREQSDVTECYRLGANSYVVKPVDFERFSIVVREIGHYWLRVNQPQKVEE